MIVKDYVPIPIKVLIRNIAAGKICKMYDIPEEKILEFPIIEYYLKSEKLNNPFVNEYHIYALNYANSEEMKIIRRLSSKINAILKSFFKRRNLNLVDIKVSIGRITGELGNSGDVTPDSIDWKTSIVLPDGPLKKLFGGLLFFPKQKEWVTDDTNFRLNMLGLGSATVNTSFKYTVLNSSGHEVYAEGYREIKLQGLFIFLKIVQQPSRPWIKIDPQDVVYEESQSPPYDKTVQLFFGIDHFHNVRVCDSDSSDVLFQGSCCFDGEVGVLNECFITKGIVKTGNAYWEVELKEGE